MSQSAAGIATLNWRTRDDPGQAGDPGQRNPLLEVVAFRRFTDGIARRCEIAPLTAEAGQIGYRLFGN